MELLHIASYYISSKVYKELFTTICNQNSDINQQVYVPIKRKEYINANKIEHERIKIYYRKIHNDLDRILYRRKIDKSFADIEKCVDLKKIDYIYAHTVFADGAVANKIYEKYGTEYVVVVRNSDVNAYLKYMPFAKKYFIKIISQAKKVIFISPTMKKDVEKRIKDRQFIDILNKKSVIIPNGINKYWHENRLQYPKDEVSQKIDFIQVSALDKNKNLYSTIDIIKKLKDIGYNVNLNIIGKGNYELKYQKYVNKLNLDNNIKFLGYIEDKKLLKDYYDKSNIYIMLSKTETFGLVYIEAMSQGLPIIYSKNTGIDGYFEDRNVGIALQPNKPNLESLENDIKYIINNYNKISKNNIEKSREFTWENVSNRYLNIIAKEE